MFMILERAGWIVERDVIQERAKKPKKAKNPARKSEPEEDEVHYYCKCMQVCGGCRLIGATSSTNITFMCR